VTKIALVPYWLKEPPQKSIAIASANLWWFQPLLEHFDHVILIAYDIDAGNCFTSLGRAQITTYRISSHLVDVIYLRDEILKILRLSEAEFTVWHVIEASISYRLVAPGDRQIKAIACVGDLHHMANPITDTRLVLTHYLYDYVLLTHPQFSHFFEVANLYTRGKNILPFPVCSDLLKSTQNQTKRTDYRVNKRITPVLFGSNLTTVTHPFRQLMTLAALDTGLISAQDKRLPFNAWIDSVAMTNAVFTCSLNGSYSLQTLAPLANESLLITDKISTKNHVGAHLVHGYNCLIYNHPKDIESINLLCQNVANTGLIAQRGSQLFASLQQADNVTKKLLGESRPATSVAHPDLFNYTITDEVVQLVETIQELHRTSLRIAIIVSSDYPRLASLQSSIDQLFPRLNLYPAGRNILADYINSLGYSFSSRDYLLIIMKPIVNPALSINTKQPLPTLFLKATQIPNSAQLAEDDAYNSLQSFTGLPLWRQKSEYHRLQFLGSTFNPKECL